MVLLEARGGSQFPLRGAGSMHGSGGGPQAPSPSCPFVNGGPANHPCCCRYHHQASSLPAAALEVCHHRGVRASAHHPHKPAANSTSAAVIWGTTQPTSYSSVNPSLYSTSQRAGGRSSTSSTIWGPCVANSAVGGRRRRRDGITTDE